MEKIKKITTLALPFVLVFLFFVVPYFAAAQGLVPNCNKEIGENGRFTNPCDFTDVMQLVNTIVNFLIFKISLPVITIVFAYAGWLFMTSGDNPGKRSQARAMFPKVLIGYVVALGAWLVINTILDLLGVPETFRFL